MFSTNLFVHSDTDKEYLISMPDNNFTNKEAFYILTNFIYKFISILSIIGVFFYYLKNFAIDVRYLNFFNTGYTDKYNDIQNSKLSTEKDFMGSKIKPSDSRFRFKFSQNNGYFDDIIKEKKKEFELNNKIREEFKSSILNLWEISRKEALEKLNNN